MTEVHIFKDEGSLPRCRGDNLTAIDDGVGFIHHLEDAVQAAAGFKGQGQEIANGSNGSGLHCGGGEEGKELAGGELTSTGEPDSQR